MIPTIETICEDLAAGKITVQQAIAWMHEHASGAANETRDFFAAKAMQALISQRCYPIDVQMPEYAYAAADAMLKHRNRMTS